MSRPNPKPGTTYGEVLGWIIRELRKQQNLDQIDLAKSLKITQPSWSRVETGSSALTVQQLGIVARKLKTTPQEILRLMDWATDELHRKGYKIVDGSANADTAEVVAVIGLLGIGALIGASLFGRKK